MDAVTITEKVIIRRVREDWGHGWTVSLILARGPQRGHEKCMAMVCGGDIGRALATQAGRLVAENYGIDEIEIDPDLMATKEENHDRNFAAQR